MPGRFGLGMATALHCSANERYPPFPLCTVGAPWKYDEYSG
jgi:hypothetical protein